MWLPVVSALAGIVAFLPFNFYPAAFVFLVPLFIFFAREEKLWRLVAGTLLFRIIFAFGTTYFTLEPILWSLSLLLFCGLPLSVWLIKKFSARFLPPASCLLLLFIFLPPIWTLFDLLEAQYSLLPTYIMTAGNALGSSPFLGLAVLGGFTALTLFAALINALLAALFTWVFHSQVKSVLVGATIFILFAGWSISTFTLSRNAAAYAALPNALSIAAISTDGESPESLVPDILKELSDRQLDLVIFPEDLFNQNVGRTTSYILGNESTLAFQMIARALHTNIIADYDTLQFEKKYNSAVLFDAEGNIAGIHNKYRLTFIGEYWPFGDWVPSFYKWMREKDPAIGDFAVFGKENADTPGEPNLLSLASTNGPVLFAAPVCLEIQYPADLAAYRTLGAKFIVNQTSNRWISGGLGLNHFIYLSTNVKKIESVSLQLPIISSGARDLAGIITPDGKVDLVPYQTADKNYRVFFGSVRY